MMYLMSIRPKYANQILDGVKRFELRRYFGIKPSTGDRVIVYASGHVQAIMGEFTVGKVIKGKPSKLYDILSKIPDSGISDEHWDYIRDAEEALAIEVVNPMKYDVKVKLSELRMIIPDFTPPYSFRVLEEGEPLYTLIIAKLEKFIKKRS